MKLWDKGTEINQLIEAFTIGCDTEMDYFLAEFDVIGSLAHIKMLESIGLLTVPELESLSIELRKIYREIKAGKFVIEAGSEDVHSQVELLLTRKLGDVGKKIHSGRSRNDQVLLDLKLFTRSEIKSVVEQTFELFDILIAQSEKYQHVLMPGYTHLQVAMPSSFGLWFGAYAESLIDDLLLLQAAYRIADQNPLGSAAGYGSSFPLNRQMTTDLLGFESMNYNVVYAQMGRGKVEKTAAFGLASVAATLSRMAYDVCLFMSQNFNFVSLPDELTTGSSIMPHKKNPDVFELLRSHCNHIQSLPNQILLMTNNLPSGYFRDLQLIKEVFIPSFAELKSCLTIASFAISNIKVNEKIMDDNRYENIYSVEEVNRKVLQGVPFRDAYRQVGESINKGDFHPDKNIHHTHEGSIGNLCLNQIREKMEEVLHSFNFSKAEKAFERLTSDDKLQ
ncbi:MAG: argininosuccinate lyase [Bacteroidia bacterium]|nr:argininosuccinate lyase [Bacteroidia bacterium]